MNTNTAVCVCSNSGLDYIPHSEQIPVMRSVIFFQDNQVFEDFTELSAETFYTRIAENPDDLPKTAYMPLGKIIELMETLESQGYKEVLLIVISSKLSGLHDALVRLSQSGECSIKIHVFDSKTLAFAQSYMALEADRMFSENQSMEAVIKRLEEIRDTNTLYFAVTTLDYLIKNGRLSKVAGTIGNFLNIRPLLALNNEGAVEPVEKIRTTTKAIQRLYEKYAEETTDKDVVTYIAHAHNDDAAQKLVQWVKNDFPTRDVHVMYLTPVVGAHVGPGGIALGYIKNQ